MPNSKQEQRTLGTPLGTLTYTLERKRVKRVNLRVRRDGSVYVSAAPRVSLDFIEDFLRRETEFIVRAQKKQSAHRPPELLYGRAGETLHIFGKLRTVVVEKGAKRGAELTETALVLTVSDPADDTARIKTLTEWIRRTAAQVLIDMASDIYRDFAPDPPEMPALAFRTMKTKWGICRPQQNRITLNNNLLFVDPILARYVIYHEFCHFRHPDHSTAFWTWLSHFVPDCRACRKALTACPVPTVAGISNLKQ